MTLYTFTHFSMSAHMRDSVAMEVTPVQIFHTDPDS